MNSSIRKIKSFFLGDLSMKISSCLILAPHISFYPFQACFSPFFSLLIWQAERERGADPLKTESRKGQRSINRSLFSGHSHPAIKGAVCQSGKGTGNAALLGLHRVHFMLKAWLLKATKNPTPKTKQQIRTEKHRTSSLIYYLYFSLAFYTNCILKSQK